MRNLIAIILLAACVVSPLSAAQKTIELPVGSHTYGPINLNDAVKSISVTVDRTHWTTPGIRVTATTTFTGNFTGSSWGCRIVGIGMAITTTPFRYSCRVPAGTSRTATVLVVVEGGTLVIGADPSFSTRE